MSIDIGHDKYSIEPSSVAQTNACNSQIMFIEPDTCRLQVLTLQQGAEEVVESCCSPAETINQVSLEDREQEDCPEEEHVDGESSRCPVSHDLIQ